MIPNQNESCTNSFLAFICINCNHMCRRVFFHEFLYDCQLKTVRRKCFRILLFEFFYEFLIFFSYTVISLISLSTVAPQDILNNIIEDVICRAIEIHYQCHFLVNLTIVPSCTPDFATLIDDIQNSRTVFVVCCADSTAENVSARRVNRGRLNQTGFCRRERHRAYAQTEDGRQQKRNRQCF